MRVIEIVRRVYGVLLHLYPASFYREFGDEMQATLADMLEEAAGRGMFSVWEACVRELMVLPFAALRERWRARGGGQMSTLPIRHVPQTWWGWLLAFIPFVLMFVITVSNMLRNYLPEWIALGVLGLLVCPLILGAARGLPDWSVASFGILAAIANLLLFNERLQAFSHWFLSPYNLAVQVIISPGLPWLGLIGLTPIVLLLTALLKPLRPFFHSVQSDWTTLSFALYSAMLLALTITFDEYVGEELFVLAALVALGAGVVFYLRSTRQDGRLAALVGGMVAAWVIVGIAKWVLIPSQNWGGVIPTERVAATRWGELSYTAVTAAWMLMVIVVAPAALGACARLSTHLTVRLRGRINQM